MAVETASYIMIIDLSQYLQEGQWAGGAISGSNALEVVGEAVTDIESIGGGEVIGVVTEGGSVISLTSLLDMVGGMAAVPMLASVIHNAFIEIPHELEIRRTARELSKSTQYDGPILAAGNVSISSRARATRTFNTSVHTHRGDDGNYTVTNSGIVGTLQAPDFAQSVASAIGLEQKSSPDDLEAIALGNYMENFLKGTTVGDLLKFENGITGIFSKAIGGIVRNFVPEGAVDLMFEAMRDAGLMNKSTQVTVTFPEHTDPQVYISDFGLLRTSFVNGGTFNGWPISFTPDESAALEDAFARFVNHNGIPANADYYWARRALIYSNNNLTLAIKINFQYAPSYPSRLFTLEWQGNPKNGYLCMLRSPENVDVEEYEFRIQYERPDLGSSFSYYGITEDKHTSRKRNWWNFNPGDNDFVSPFGHLVDGATWVVPKTGVVLPSDPGDTVAKVYPNWHNNKIDIQVGIDDDGDPVTRPYIPLLPSPGTIAQPQVDPELGKNGVVQNPDGTLPELSIIPGLQNIIENLLNNIPKKAPTIAPLVENPTVDTSTPGEGPETPDTGSVPTIELPEFTAFAGDFYNMYRVPDSEIMKLRGFNAWLWSGDILTNILKLFQKPLDSILNFGTFYLPVLSVPVQAASGINLGNMTYSVSIDRVAQQVVSIDCGSVSIPYYYNSVLDFEPYTAIAAYLPYVGLVDWSCADIMDSTISIKYNIDLLSGASMCIVTVSRNNGVSVPKYIYECNTMLSIPLSGSDFSRVYASLATSAIGAAAGIASGGAALPALGVAKEALGIAQSSPIPVFRTGGVSSNAGALGPKKPYILIKRRNIAMPNKFNQFIGYPSNGYSILGGLSGYTRVSKCHLDGVPATSEELTILESILKEGVIL